MILILPMSIGLSPRDLEEKFESEFGRLVPNKEESTPQDIKKAALTVCKKFRFWNFLKIECEKLASGLPKCKLKFKVKIVTA